MSNRGDCDLFTVCLKILMLATFTAHAVFGCCLHHQHQNCCESSASLIKAERITKQKISTCHHCCEHDAEHSASEPVLPAPGNNHDGCDEPTCSFLSAGNQQLDFDFSVLSFVYLTINCNKGSSGVLCSDDMARGSARCHGIYGSPHEICISQSSWQL